MHQPQRLDLGGALLELVRLGRHPLQHQPDLAAVLAPQAVELLDLLGELAAQVEQTAQDLLADRVERLERHALEHRAALGQQLLRQRLLQRRQPAVGQRLRIARDPAGQRLARRQRKDPLRRDLQRARHLLALQGDLRLAVLGRRQRIDQRIDLVQHHIAGQRLRGQMVAPDLEVGAGHAGVRPQHEDHHMRIGQQPDGELGLGADRVQTRRVEHHQTALEQRMRHIDQRMAPQRDLDLAIGPQRRVVGRLLVVPEAELAGLVEAGRTHAAHRVERLRQRGRITGIDRHAAPELRLRPQLGQRGAFQPGLDRQQRQPRRILRLPAQLDRAHRGAPRRGRHDAPAGIGEEDRVDQLGLAARELGDEGHHQLLAGQALAQRVQQRPGVLVEQALLAQEARQIAHPLLQGRAPLAQRIEAAHEGLVHRFMHRFVHRFVGQRGGGHAAVMFAHCGAPGRTGTRGTAPGADSQAW